MKITNAERRFIDHWSEEKKGPKWKFYLLFTIAWSIVSFLVIFFLIKLFTNLWQTGGANLIYLLIIVSFISGFLSTHFSYVINEKKFKAIMRKIKSNMN